ncbi:hypothetical protein DXA74_11495 [Bacteroides sp. OF04-15BH]|nr:hypothetical protein DXA74_11495 [Bacteroides sp. OF04-15BH]
MKCTGFPAYELHDFCFKFLPEPSLLPGPFRSCFGSSPEKPPSSIYHAVWSAFPFSFILHRCIFASEYS